MSLTEPFAAGNSIFHRLDPRAKVVAATVWCVALAVLSNVFVLALGLAIAITLIALARLSPRRLLRQLLWVNVFIAFMWLVVPWSVTGETIWRWGPIDVTREGLLLTLRLTLRCNAIVCATIALLGTSRLVDVAHALQALRVPAKLVLIIFFCVRYVQVIHDEFARMISAIRLRAFQPRTNLHSYRTYANLAGLLLVRSHDRAARVHDAMLCRGFDGRLPAMTSMKIHSRDLTVAAVLTSLTLILVVLECLKTG